jgi:hypothetical protein
VVRGLGLALVLSGVAACGGSGQFQCADDEQCGADGQCEVDGNCSFPDDTCPSGRRYGDLGVAGLAGMCVAVAGTGSGSTGSNGSVTTTTTAATSAGDTLAVDDSGGGTSLGDTTSPPPADTGDSSGDTTGGAPTFTFFDDFERPDGDDIGNGWWEKSTDAWELDSGRVARINTMSGYPDNLVLRPEEEKPRDVELMVTILPLMVSPLGHPQIHVRVQPEDVDVSGSVTGYILYVDNADLLQVTRQEAGVFAEEYGEPLSAPLELQSIYRLRLRIEGQDPVMLDGYLEEQTAEGDWQIHTEIHWADASPTRIDGEGRLGFSGHTEIEQFFYDDFGYLEL